jgi:hypothetical protein
MDLSSNLKRAPAREEHHADATARRPAAVAAHTPGAWALPEARRIASLEFWTGLLVWGLALGLLYWSRD